MNTQSDAAQDRAPKTNITVVVADKASVEAAEQAGISAIYCSDIDTVEAKDLAADLDGADAAVILPPTGATKEFVQSIWALTRALRDLGMPATYRPCHEDKRKSLTGLAGWIKLDGAGVVKKILEQAAADAIQRTKRKAVGGYVAVGFDGDRSVVWSVPRQSLHNLGPRDLGDAMLQTVCGAAWCADNFTVHSQKGGAKVDLNLLRAELIDACRDAGPYSAKEIRGAGCWRVAPGVLAINNSDMLWRTDGQPIERIGKRDVYPVSKNLGLSPDALEASDVEAREVLDLLRTWRWARQSDPTLLLGWIAQAAVVGALDRRPHIMVTGARGSGKTTLLDCVFRLLGKSALKIDGGSTAAGVRQRLKHDARAVMIDEFESKSDHEAMRVRALIEQMRSAYSDGVGDGVLRGTVDGTGTAYTVRYSALCSMIVPPAMEAADRTRFAQLDLLPFPRHLRTPKLAIDEVRLEELGQKLRMRMIKHYGDLVDTVARIRDYLIGKGYSPRLGDTIGGLLGAAYVCLNGHALFDELDTCIWIKDTDIDDHAAMVENASDEDECASWLLGASVRIYDDTLTVAEAMHLALDEIACGEDKKAHSTSKALERFGVRVYADELAVARKALEGLRTIFRGSKFADGGWSAVLGRLPGAYSDSVRVAGAVTAVLRIPLASIKAFARRPEQRDLELRVDNVRQLSNAAGGAK